jgi:hypothetical protein
VARGDADVVMFCSPLLISTLYPDEDLMLGGFIDPICGSGGLEKWD